MTIIRNDLGHITSSTDTLSRQYRKFKLPGMAIALLSLASLILPNVSGLLSMIFQNAPDFEIDAIIGWLSLLAGILYSVHIFQTREIQKPLLKLPQAALYLSVGAYLLLFYSTGPLPFTFFFTMFFLMDSIMKFLVSSQNRYAKGTKWAIKAGIINVILSMSVATGLPSGAAWAIGLFFAINLFLTGMMCISYSLTVPRANNQARVFRPTTTAAESA